MCSIAEKMRPEGEKGGMPIVNMKNATADIRSFLTLSMRHPISVSQSSDSMRYAMLRSSCDV